MILLQQDYEGTEIIKVDYMLETPVDGCLDISSRHIYIRPVYIISEKDYIDDFDSRQDWDGLPIRDCQ